MSPTAHFLVVDSEPREARKKKEAKGQLPSAESFAQTLLKVNPHAEVEFIAPGDRDGAIGTGLSSFDGVFLSGSPLHFYEETEAVRRVIDFMRAVFASGVPSFGSCAGLQIATVAAGGEVGPKKVRHEAGFARHISKTAPGLNHPMLAGRPYSFDAPAIHSDEVRSLPKKATVLAQSEETAVHAAEIIFDKGVFWGVQYHPEISLHEVANVLQSERQELIKTGFVRLGGDLDRYTAQLNELHIDTDRSDLAWQLGLNSQVTNPERRVTELRNFVEVMLKRRPV